MGTRRAASYLVTFVALLLAAVAGCSRATPPGTAVSRGPASAQRNGRPAAATPVAPAPAQPAADAASATPPGHSPAAGSHAAPAAGPQALGSLAPNETGQVMIVEYHVIGPEEGRWARTPENFRRDLEELYRRGYRPVNLTDLLDRRVDLPKGYSPVVLTFDDGTAGQFRYIVKDGKRLIDPDSAVGILLDFHEKHPDWGLRATFYVNDLPFEQADSWPEKVRFLVEQGFEVGNHTLTHANLARLDAAGTMRELAGQVRLLREAVPDLQPQTLALPYGGLPRAAEAAKTGSHQGTSYRIRAFLLVGANPAPSPHSPRFDPYRLPRIQAVDSRFESTSNLDRWLRYFDEHPERRYVSDGDPATVAGLSGGPGQVAPDAGKTTTEP